MEPASACGDLGLLQRSDHSHCVQKAYVKNAGNMQLGATTTAGPFWTSHMAAGQSTTRLLTSTPPLWSSTALWTGTFGPALWTSTFGPATWSNLLTLWCLQPVNIVLIPRCYFQCIVVDLVDIVVLICLVGCLQTSVHHQQHIEMQWVLPVVIATQQFWCHTLWCCVCS